jgi:hypothetical protein
MSSVNTLSAAMSLLKIISELTEDGEASYGPKNYVGVNSIQAYSPGYPATHVEFILHYETLITAGFIEPGSDGPRFSARLTDNGISALAAQSATTP